MKIPILNKYQALLIYAYSLNPVENIEDEIYELLTEKHEIEKQSIGIDKNKNIDNVERLKTIKKEMKILNQVIKDLKIKHDIY
tara:strand:- start:421 stop:669 length:249 start_codon:yes stop_codon:yes gene_type:complete